MTTHYILIALATLACFLLVFLCMVLKQLVRTVEDLADDADLIRSSTESIQRQVVTIATPFHRAADEEFDAWVREDGMQLRNPNMTGPTAMRVLINALAALLRPKKKRPQ